LPPNGTSGDLGDTADAGSASGGAFYGGSSSGNPLSPAAGQDAGIGVPSDDAGAVEESESDAAAADVTSPPDAAVGDATAPSDGAVLDAGDAAPDMSCCDAESGAPCRDAAGD